MTQGRNYETYTEGADYIRERLERTPDAAVVLGTGCSPFASRIENAVTIPYRDIPHFPVTTNPSHKGEMVAGYIGGKYCLCLNGRFHYYEGYSMEELDIPVHVMHVLGIPTVVLTNAAGSCNPDIRPGDAMIIKDHIKLFGGSPMRGENIPSLGPRFFSVSDMYTSSIREKAKALSSSASINVHEGVYMFFPGPQFETASEIRAARILGADCVGMSTVTEALTAAHSGMKLFALALITNWATGMTGEDNDGSEVDAVAAVASSAFSSYLEAVIGSL